MAAPLDIGPVARVQQQTEITERVLPFPAQIGQEDASTTIEGCGVRDKSPAGDVGGEMIEDAYALD